MKRNLSVALSFLLLMCLSTEARIISQMDPIPTYSEPMDEKQPGSYPQTEESMIFTSNNTGEAKSGFYIGVGVGYANHQYNYVQNLNGVGITANPANDTATLSLFPGFQMLVDDWMLGFEALYIFDKSKNYSDWNNPGVSQENTTITSNHTWGCALRTGLQIMPGIIPYISLGWRQQSIRVKAYVEGNNANGIGVNQEHAYNAFVPGVGIDYRMNDEVTFRAQYDEAFYQKRTMNTTNNTLGFVDMETIKPRIRTLSLGASYHF